MDRRARFFSPFATVRLNEMDMDERRVEVTKDGDDIVTYSSKLRVDEPNDWPNTRGQRRTNSRPKCIYTLGTEWSASRILSGHRWRILLVESLSLNSRWNVQNELCECSHKLFSRFFFNFVSLYTSQQRLLLLSFHVSVGPSDSIPKWSSGRTCNFFNYFVSGLTIFISPFFWLFDAPDDWNWNYFTGLSVWFPECI